MEGMVAELEGRLLPTTILVRRLIAEGGPVDAVIEFDPRLGEARAAPHVNAWPGGCVQPGIVAVALATSRPFAMISADRAGHRRARPPLTLVLAVAHHEPLVYVDPDSAWSLLETDASVGEHGRGRSTLTFPSVMPSCVACSRFGC